jgi:hypothetical protein
MRHVGNLAPMPGVFPGYPPVTPNTDTGTKIAMITRFDQLLSRICSQLQNSPVAVCLSK